MKIEAKSDFKGNLDREIHDFQAMKAEFEGKQLRISFIILRDKTKKKRDLIEKLELTINFQ